MVEIFLLALGLSMDSFAVSLTIGTVTKKKILTALKVAGLFGLFQSIMPLFGWFIGVRLREIISGVDHYVVLIILGFIGLKMIEESFANNKKTLKLTSFTSLILLAMATSIDALMVGLSFAFIQINLLQQLIAIGLVTFIISFIGVISGSYYASLLKKKAYLFGGLILIFIGLKTLLEHLVIK